MPQILNAAAAEYDRMQKEIFTLKKANDDCRKQLSAALYQNEAACYTVKRLMLENKKMKEQATRAEDLVNQMRQDQTQREQEMARDQARREDAIRQQAEAERQALEQQRQQQAREEQARLEEQARQEEQARHEAEETAKIEPEPARPQAKGVSESVIQSFEDKAEELISGRKGKKPPAEYPTKKDFMKFKQASQGTIDCAVISSQFDNNVMLFSTEDGKQILRAPEMDDQVIDHPGAASFVPESNMIFMQGDQPVVLNIQTNQKEYVVTSHKRVTCHSFHPIANYLVCGSDDGSWSLHDIEARQLLCQVDVGTPISSIEVHPDGLIFAMGLVDGRVVIYDLRDQKEAQVLGVSCNKPVQRLEFSNKGMYLAAAWQNH